MSDGGFDEFDDFDDMPDFLSGTLRSQPSEPSRIAADSGPSGLSRSRKGVIVALSAVVTVVGAVTAFGGESPEPTELPEPAALIVEEPPIAAPLPDIAIDAWVPYWALDGSLPSAPQRLDSMREVSPFWFDANGATDISISPYADVDAANQFMELARASDAQVVPSIVDAMPAGGMAAVLADPATRAAHVDAIVAFADDGDFDGIDLDYEQFAFADGTSTWQATRPNWVLFVEELGARLRDDDRLLAVSIPPIFDDERSSSSGFWVYDHDAIEPHVDRIRIMAYDYSVSDPGPIAPLEFVEKSVLGALDVIGAPDKIVLGLPAYGRNWPVGLSGDCAAADVQGVTGVTARTIGDLIERRNAEPVYDETLGEWSFAYDLNFEGSTCIQRREVHYVDGAGVRSRMDIARANDLGGVSLWAFGFEDPSVWNAMLDFSEPTIDG